MVEIEEQQKDNTNVRVQEPVKQQKVTISGGRREVTPFYNIYNQEAQFFELAGKKHPDATHMDNAEYQDIRKGKSSTKEVHDELLRRGFQFFQHPYGCYGFYNGYYHPQRNVVVDLSEIHDGLRKESLGFSEEEHKQFKKTNFKNNALGGVDFEAKRIALAAQQKLADARAKKGEFLRDLSERMKLNKKKNE